MENEELTIKIYPHSEGGYTYSIYLTSEPDEDADEDDGGICTGTFLEAIDMATSHAKDTINYLTNE